MKTYAYLDKYGILHASTVKETAKKYAEFNGKIEETNLGSLAGYLRENNKTPFIYHKEHKFYDNGNAKRGKEVTETRFKELYPESYKTYLELIK